MQTTLPVPVIYICCTYINTCWTKPNDAGHFYWPITIRKRANYVAGSRCHFFCLLWNKTQSRKPIGKKSFPKKCWTVNFLKTKLLRNCATIRNVGQITHQNGQNIWLCYVLSYLQESLSHLLDSLSNLLWVCAICCELCPICRELKFSFVQQIMFCPNQPGPTVSIFWSPASIKYIL